MTDDEWAAEWVERQSDRGAAAAMAETDDPARTEADYRFSWEVGRRIMQRPGFVDMLRERMTALDRKYGAS